MPSISYAITACNEHVELERLLSFLKKYIRPIDELIIQLDTNHTNQVLEVCNLYTNFNGDGSLVFSGAIPNSKFYSTSLNNNFATFKNYLNQNCTKEYIFQIDADEVPNIDLIISLPEILEANPDVDVFLVPRINTVEGITTDHVKKWGWRLNENKWINYPDFQWRIYKNSSEIYWMNRVHERLYGFKEFSYLPEEESYSLYHPKTIERQEKQNNFYNTL